MSTSAIIFYAISALILGAGLLAVTSRKIFRSAIYLLSSLVGIAALYFWMQVEFIAAVQIAVYVGGIVVLIIFSIFLTHESGKELPTPPLRRIIFAILAVLFGFASTYNLISEYGFQPTGKPFTVSVSDMGTQMLSPTEYGYLLPFEVVSILLLAAMIGCIVIAMKPSEPGPAESKEAAIEKNKLTPAPEETIVVVSKSTINEEVPS
ncbi:MAG TPA: NADH-quinone oxidoreductase subunit J [Flavisolibacter sp.]|jgi:NADH-quinone oxidoreductase subunit J|nr:NADH-quinone oxidoreductase subunit J [Flavisolibacter sp.]